MDQQEGRPVKSGVALQTMDPHPAEKKQIWALNFAVGRGKGDAVDIMGAWCGSPWVQPFTICLKLPLAPHRCFSFIGWYFLLLHRLPQKVPQVLRKLCWGVAWPLFRLNWSVGAHVFPCLMTMVAMPFYDAKSFQIIPHYLSGSSGSIRILRFWLAVASFEVEHVE